MQTSLFGQTERPDATLSRCGRYRYVLSRVWDDALPPVVFLMVNPSTADAKDDDPTIKRCRAFAKSWGFGGFMVVNLFALRSTDPAGLARVEDPVGPENDAWIKSVTFNRRVVVAWGCEGAYLDRDLAVVDLLGDRPLECLGYTKDGHPRHPLFLRATLVPVPFQPRTRG